MPDGDVRVAVGSATRHLPRVVTPAELLTRSLAVAGRARRAPSAAYAMARRQLRTGTLERIARDAPAIDRAVGELWADDDAVARIGAQLERLRGDRPGLMIVALFERWAVGWEHDRP